VPDEIWAAAAAHHDYAQLAAITLMIATVRVRASAEHPSWA